MSMTVKNTGADEKRGSFSSQIGFILAATGSAVGLGNLWKFPYVAGENGGGVFLIFYLIFVLILGVPLFMAEMAIGRKTKLNPIGAYRKLDKRFTFVGVIGVVCAFTILSFYSVIGGWVLKYITTYATNSPIANPDTYYDAFIATSGEPVIFCLLFIVITASIVVLGVSNGIEAASKVMLPALFVLLLLVVVRSLTLPGAIEGVRYFLIPQWSDIDTLPKLANMMLAAMGQVFFSLSLGMGALITYGSYLNKNANIQKSSFLIAGLDTLIAIFAGLAILPAVFAFNYTPAAGEGLLFKTLPQVFNLMPAGNIFGLLFFVLVFFAAVTSSVSLLEVVISFCIDNLRMKRITSTVIVATIIAAISTLAALSYGVLANVNIFSMSIFGALSFFADNILMPLGGLFCCIFVGYVWGVDNMAIEITNNGALQFKSRPQVLVCLKFIAPILIGIIFISTLLK